MTGLCQVLQGTRAFTGVIITHGHVMTSLKEKEIISPQHLLRARHSEGHFHNICHFIQVRCGYSSYP